MNSKRMMIRWTRAIAVAAILLPGVSAAAAAPVRVKVFESTGPSGATYTYRVQNGTTQPIVGVRIGFDYLHGQSQLHALPVGWTLAGGLTSSSAASPQGWTARLVTTEESDLVDLEWSSDSGPQWDVAAGATASGFSVSLAQPTAEYRTCAFDVILGDSTHVYGLLEPDNEPPPPTDTTPPTLLVTLAPSVIWPPNHKMITVTVTIAVSDNVDPHPSVRLVSITANEPLEAGDIARADFGSDDRQFDLRADRSGQRKEGRVYTVKYSATDASGNIATATATVMVPHDQRP